jgi:hypothetical protein
MSKPTKEAIEEAYRLAKEFVATHAREVSPLMLFPEEIANLITHVRKQARDDAAQKCHEIMMQQRAIAGDFDEWEHGKADGAKMCRDALKTQGDAQ